MRKAAPRAGDCWPTSEQTLLLRAALLTGEDGQRALDAWLERADAGRLDPGTRRLLPLLRTRLPVGHPIAPLAEAAYRHADAHNAGLIESAAAVIGALRADGIDSLLLKGMALVARGFVVAGERPMADADLLVGQAQALAAKDVLTRAGWRTQSRLDAGVLTLRHSANFRSADDRQLDLHWHVLAECCHAGADDRFWQASAPAAIGGETSGTLCPEDMLLHACVHGLRWSRTPPVRWVVDAVAIVRGAGRGFDWTRVADESERRLLALPVAEALRYLRRAIGVDVPAAVLDRLDRVVMPRWTTPEYRVKLRRRSPVRQLAYHWYLNRRMHAARSFAGAALRFPWYLRRRRGTGD